MNADRARQGRDLAPVATVRPPARLFSPARTRRRRQSGTSHGKRREMASLRWWALGAVLLTLHCKADACGAHVELGGPSLKTEGQLRTRGPMLPLPANKL